MSSATALSRFKSIDVTGQQRRHLLHQAVHGLHGRGLQVARLDERRGLPVRHPTLHQADARAEDRRDIVTITAALARNPIRGVTAAVPMITEAVLKPIATSADRERCSATSTSSSPDALSPLAGRTRFPSSPYWDLPTTLPTHRDRPSRQYAQRAAAVLDRRRRDDICWREGLHGCPDSQARVATRA